MTTEPNQTKDPQTEAPQDAATPAQPASKTVKQFSKGWLRMLRVLDWVAYNYNRLEVRGIENVPPKGHPALLCANHPGLLDPAYIHLPILRECKRWMRWLGWAGLLKSNNKFIKWIIGNVGTMVPVEEHQGKAKSRSEAEKTFDLLSKELQEGHLVGLFPEGLNHKVHDAKKPYHFRTGAVRLAARNNVPIIPVALYGTQWVWVTVGEIKLKKFHMWITLPAWLPAKVRVAFGEPFYLSQELYDNPDNYELARAETERLKEVVYELVATLY